MAIQADDDPSSLKNFRPELRDPTWETYLVVEGVTLRVKGINEEDFFFDIPSRPRPRI
ncbi:hypothetical protein BDN72DRAFT_842119 [Pluteus cervinus]|uniref:Uncharacterized protein n=1 Tax=Pluteus cervinus TaxID=181527 RepID=A0ACD3ARD6_9AGAR|nr:hypothetical protein BDN72DRAFT_842119 [Pluteus cervinus]